MIRLFHAERFRNCIYCTIVFIYLCCCCFSRVFITQLNWIRIILNGFILHTAEILTGTTIPGQSGPGSNGNEEVIYTLYIWYTDTTQTSSTTLRQSRHGSNINEEVLNALHFWPIDENPTGTTILVRVDLVVMAMKRYSTLFIFDAQIGF